MRTIKSLLLIVALSLTSVLAASTNSNEKRAESSAITEEVGKLLKNPSFLIEKDVFANVTLTINKNNEFVVLTVDTDADYLVSFIKSRLNYNALSIPVNFDEKTFIVPVRITPEN